VVTSETKKRVRSGSIGKKWVGVKRKMTQTGHKPVGADYGMNSNGRPDADERRNQVSTRKMQGGGSHWFCLVRRHKVRGPWSKNTSGAQ